LAFWVVLLLYLALIGGVAWLVGQAIPLVGVIIFLVALIGMIPIYRLAYRYVFYLIKAAHIAVISELLVQGRLPSGSGQLSWGTQQVKDRFGETTVLFVADELVTAVVRSFTNTVYRVASWLPGDSIRKLANVVNRILRYALTYIDEAILARIFWLDQGSIWANAQDGVVLYAMLWKPLLMNAMALMVLSYIPFIAAFIIFAAPVGFLVALISPQAAGWSIIALLLLSWLIKVALGDSLAMTAMIAAYQRETAALEPDPAISAQLEQVSDKFGELKQRAQAEMGRLGGQPPAAEAPPVG
jgi:hypothetical protein